MHKQIIHTADAPGSKLYSQAVRVGPAIYVSGIVGIDQSTGKLAGDTGHITSVGFHMWIRPRP